MIRAVFAKELADSFRDRRSVASAFIYPLLGPLLLGFTLWMVAEWQRTDRPLDLPVVGAEHAPALVDWLDGSGVTIEEPPDDPEAAVRDGEASAVLIIPESYEEEFRSGRPVKLRLLVDDSKNRTLVQTQRVHELLAAYGAQMGAMRLLARGISPEIASPIQVERVDLSTPERLAATLLNALPVLLIIAVFVGGMNVAIDVTAGERERGSLEPLLINPASRGSLMAGKWGATVLFSILVLALMVAGMSLMTRLFSFEGLGVDVRIGPLEAVLMFAAMASLAPLAGVVQLYVATFARSFKEAQTYLSLLLFVPMLPAVILGLHPLQPEPWMMLIPGLAQILLVTDLMAGESPGFLAFALAAAGSLIAAALIFKAASRLLSREEIIFGR